MQLQQIAARAEWPQGADDAALVASIPNRPEEALAEIYDRHGGAVLGLARRLLTDAGLAQDVTQEVFLRFWNRAGRFDPARGSLRSFLLADCHGRSVDLIRAEVARRRREHQDVVIDLRDAFVGRDVAGEVCEAAVADRVRTALATLPELERNAIESAYFGGRTYREVADLLRTPVGTVKSRIRSGLGRLRSELADIPR